MKLPLQIVPLGGVGKFGMNCMLVGHRDRWVMVDCGVQFPPADMIGAERVLPDLSFLDRFRDRLEAVLITHGHEDHIGALPWVLPRLDPATPVFASPFTTELIRDRLSEHGVWDAARMRGYTPGVRFEAGPFEVEPIRVTHSLPDCASLALRCEDGTVLHTGDWKIDDEPVDGEDFDRAAFERLGDEGLTVLLSDSTNIFSPGRTTSEASVGRALAQRVAAWPGRVIITQFASNLHRMELVARMAADTGRQLVLCGASLARYAQAATRARRPPFPPGTVMSMEDARDLDPGRALIVTTGSQGEGRAALMRAALGTHRSLVVGTGDLLLHSARVIPGNETGVVEMFNHLAQRGVEIVAGRATGIHASGHAQRDEIAELFRLTRPACFVPVHGEYTFLRAHAELARECEVTSTTVLQNGELLGIARGKQARVTDTARLGFEPLSPIYNDGPATGDADAMRLSERKRIAWNGVVVIDVAITRDAEGRLSASARARTRALFDDDDTLDGRLARVAERVVAACPARTPLREIEEAVAASVRRAVKKALEKRPDVIVTLHTGVAA